MKFCGRDKFFFFSLLHLQSHSCIPHYTKRSVPRTTAGAWRWWLNFHASFRPRRYGYSTRPLCAFEACWRRTKDVCVCVGGGRNSSADIATCYGFDGPGIRFRWGEIFRTRPDRPWGPPSLLYNLYRVLPRGKVAGAWRWPPTPHLAPRLKIEQSYNFTPLLGFRGHIWGELYVWSTHIKEVFIRLSLTRGAFQCAYILRSRTVAMVRMSAVNDI